MKELWRPVAGYEGCYEVSNCGQVRSVDRTRMTKRGPWRYKGKLLKSGSGGYRQQYRNVHLWKDDKGETRLVHHLVAFAFIGPRPSIDHVIDHIDENKHNNNVSNLRYLLGGKNLSRSVKGEKSHMAKLTDADVRAIRADTRPSRIVATEYGVSKTVVKLVRSRKTWKHVN